MTGWEKKLLGDVCDVLDSRRRPVARGDRRAGEYPYYGATGIVDYVNEFIFDEPLVLVGEDGAKWGAGAETAFSVSGRCWVNNHAHVLRPHRTILLDQWLVYYLVHTDLSAFVSGLTVPKLNQGRLREIPVPMPPVAEQRRIVTILDEAFDAIATAKSNTEKSLRNAHDLFESHRETLLANSGDGWKSALLGDLCDIKHGYAFEGKFFAQDGDYVLLTPGNFFESGGYRDRGEKQKYFIGPIPRDYILEEGSLLVAMTEQAAGLLGSPLLVPESDRFLHNQRLGHVVGKPGAPWTNDYFFHVFNLKRVRAEIHASASGVKVRHTSPGKIAAVRVPFPASVSEQRATASRLSELASECERLAQTYERKNKILDELKQSLLHQAFTGQLTAQRTDQQVAELA